MVLHILIPLEILSQPDSVFGDTLFFAACDHILCLLSYQREKLLVMRKLMVSCGILLDRSTLDMSLPFQVFL
jgi:hypothetical protein